MGFSSSVDSFWTSYLSRLLPGWPEHQTVCQYYFSLLLLFLLTVTAEFCSNQQINRSKTDRCAAALRAAAVRALTMFMTYLAIMVILANDFVFLLVAVGGHAAGHIVVGLYQSRTEQAIPMPV